MSVILGGNNTLAPRSQCTTLRTIPIAFCATMILQCYILPEATSSAGTRLNGECHPKKTAQLLYEL